MGGRHARVADRASREHSQEIDVLKRSPPRASQANLSHVSAHITPEFVKRWQRSVPAKVFRSRAKRLELEVVRHRRRTGRINTARSRGVPSEHPFSFVTGRLRSA